MDLQLTELNNTLKNVRPLPRNGGLEARVPEHMYPTLCTCANRHGTAPPAVERIATLPVTPAANVARCTTLGH
jgi:hypothetical protein